MSDIPGNKPKDQSHHTDEESFDPSAQRPDNEFQDEFAPEDPQQDAGLSFEEEDSYIDDSDDWGDDPSVADDDFSGDFDTDFADDDGMDEAYEDYPPSAAAVQKDSFVKKHFNKILIGVAVLGGVLFFLNSLNQKGAEVNQASNQNQASSVLANDNSTRDLVFGGQTGANQNTDDPLASLNEQTPDSQAQTSGILNNPDRLANLGAPPQPAPITTPNDDLDDLPSVDNDGVEAPAAPEDSSQEPSPFGMAQSSGANTQELERLPEPKDALGDIPTLAVPAEPVQSEVLEPQANTASNDNQAMFNTDQFVKTEQLSSLQNDLQSLESRFDGLEKTLSTLTQEIQKLADRPSPQASNNGNADPALAKEVSDLQAMLKQLETQVSNIARQPAASAAPKSAPAPAKPKAQPAQPKAAQPAPAPKKVVTPQVVTSWILKAAQPGEALVQKQGSNELRRVRIGDSLPGVGIVRNVSTVSGRWVVDGTEGLIRQ